MNKYFLMAFLGVNLIVAIMIGVIYAEVQSGSRVVPEISGIIPEKVVPQESPAQSCT